MVEKTDLFTRAREAAAKVKELRGEILVRKIELKKALADARRYKTEVMQQLAGVRKPRTMKAKSQPSVVNELNKKTDPAPGSGGAAGMAEKPEPNPKEYANG